MLMGVASSCSSIQRCPRGLPRRTRDPSAPHPHRRRALGYPSMHSKRVARGLLELSTRPERQPDPRSDMRAPPARGWRSRSRWRTSSAPPKGLWCRLHEGDYRLSRSMSWPPRASRPTGTIPATPVGDSGPATPGPETPPGNHRRNHNRSSHPAGWRAMYPGRNRPRTSWPWEGPTTAEQEPAPELVARQLLPAGYPIGTCNRGRPTRRADFKSGCWSARI